MAEKGIDPNFHDDRTGGKKIGLYLEKLCNSLHVSVSVSVSVSFVCIIYLLVV